MFAATVSLAASSVQKAKASKTQIKQAGKCQVGALSVHSLGKVALKNTLPFALSAVKYFEPAETLTSVINGCLRDISEVKCEGIFTLLTW